MRVTFLLPGTGRVPVGGFKVVYEYANGLAARGHEIAVVHTARHEPDLAFPERLRRTASFVKRKVLTSYGPSPWFRLDPRVRTTWAPSLAASRIPDADAVVATAWQTSEACAGYPPSKGRKLYLVQSWETWSGSEARVAATWKLPFEKVVISKWLLDIATSMNERATYIPNGIDFEAFGVDTDPLTRRADSFLMLSSGTSLKGTRDGLRALDIVQRKRPDAAVALFGTGPSPRKLPRGIAYHRNPSQSVLRSLYNGAAIFVAPSHTEGWPLPPAEAMTCGCALAATDIGGHREYAIHEETALLSPARDPEALAANLLRLVEDAPLRMRLASAGRAHILNFTWTRAVDSFEQVLRKDRPAR